MKQLRRYLSTVVVAAALILTAYNGSLNWLLLLVFAAILIPGWKPLFRRFLEKKSNACDPDRPD